MANHVVRLYALAVGAIVFFVLWATIAARPWTTAKAKADPRLAQLSVREKRLRHDAILANRIVKRRWAVYRVRLRRRETEIASARTRHEQELAAARAAAARQAAAIQAAALAAAAARSQTVAPAAVRTAGPVAAAPAVAAPVRAAAPAATPAPPPPPPPVAVVRLPPITTTHSS